VTHHAAQLKSRQSDAPFFAGERKQMGGHMTDKSFSVSDLTSFEKLVAPRLLKIVYWLGLIGIAGMALITMVGALGAMQYSFATGLGTLLLAAIGLGFGVLMWRVLIEIYMVFFGIYERIGEIRDRLDTK
jgi:hypothetical protein